MKDTVEALRAAGVLREAPARTADAAADETIPRAFLALADVGTLSLAFLLTGLAAPWVQWLLLSSGPLRLALPSWLSLPDSPAFDQFPPLWSVMWVLLATSPMTVIFMDLLGGYRQLANQSRTRLVMTAVFSPAMALAFLALALFASKTTDSSRVFVFTFGLLSMSGLLAYRGGLWTYKRRRLLAGTYAKNVLVLGNASAIRSTVEHFRRNVPAGWYQVSGCMMAGPGPEPGVPGLRVYGPASELRAVLVHDPIHEVVAVQSPGDPNWLAGVIDSCDYFRMRLHIIPEVLLGGLGGSTLLPRSGALGLPAIVLAPPNLDTDALFVKRLIDITVSALLLVLLAPVFLLIAIGIKVTTPRLKVFYPWRVIGLKGKPFTGYKFTTMVADAEGQREALLAQNEMSGPVFKIKNDPRITPLGGFLRRYSLNELPQLWSVLKGDMSLVGPRPAFRHELDRYELWHKRKLCVRPGMTCLWQISGRNRISNFDDWVRLDLEYIDKWSNWLDVRILARTVWAVIAGSGS